MDRTLPGTRNGTGKGVIKQMKGLFATFLLFLLAFALWFHMVLVGQIKDNQADMKKRLVRIERALHPGIDTTKFEGGR